MNENMKVKPIHWFLGLVGVAVVIFINIKFSDGWTSIFIGAFMIIGATIEYFCRKKTIPTLIYVLGSSWVVLGLRILFPEFRTVSRYILAILAVTSVILLYTKMMSESEKP